MPNSKKRKTKADLGECVVFVATDPTIQSVVVAHQGTDPTKVLSVLNDAQFFPTDLDTKRFPNSTGNKFPVCTL